MTAIHWGVAEIILFLKHYDVIMVVNKSHMQCIVQVHLQTAFVMETTMSHLLCLILAFFASKEDKTHREPVRKNHVPMYRVRSNIWTENIPHRVSGKLKCSGCGLHEDSGKVSN